MNTATSSPANDYGVVPEPGVVRIERLLPGPIERIWSYLTDSDKRAQWLASGAIELRVDGLAENIFRNSELTANDDAPPAKYAKLAGEHRVDGRVTACEPPRLLSYTCGETSEVRFDLTPIASEVLLVITHRRLDSHDAMLSVAAGWHAHLGILADRLEGREPAGFWRTHTRLEAEYGERIPRVWQAYEPWPPRADRSPTKSSAGNG